MSLWVYVTGALIWTKKELKKKRNLHSSLNWEITRRLHIRSTSLNLQESPFESSPFALLSSDSGSSGQMTPASATSAPGTAAAASVAAGFLEVPTWAWTSSSWKSWRHPLRQRSPLPALSRTWRMASLCCSQGSGSLPRKPQKWMVRFC